jgi:hypothetical protein
LSVSLNRELTTANTAVLNVSWQDTGDETGYVLESVVGDFESGMATRDTLLANTTSFAFSALRGETDSVRNFRILAFGQDSVSPYSQEVAINVPARSFNLSPESVPLRINCGGQAVTTVRDKVARHFIADKYFTTGSQPRSISVGDIAGTVNDILYHTFRSGDEFAYRIPVRNGQYQLYLNFAELFFTAPGQRVFSVNIEGGEAEWVDLDVFAAAGGAGRALSRNFPVTITDGVLDISFASRVSRAMISVIQIVPAGSSAREATEPLAELMQETDLHLYPNPSDGAVAVSFPPSETGPQAVVEVYNLQGVLVERQADSHRNGQVMLNQARQLATGMYVVKVRSVAGDIQRKLIVTR